MLRKEKTMSHYSVAVFSENNGNDVDELLEPYDENIEVERYVDLTKDELIGITRDQIEKFRDSVYADYLSDPLNYLRKHCNGDIEDKHFKYVRYEFPKLLLLTDEEIYQDAIKYYDPESIGEDGEIYSMYNPQAKWDWYTVGGRFKNMLMLKDSSGKKVNEAYVIDIDFTRMEEEKSKSLTPYTQFLSSSIQKPMDEDSRKEMYKQMYPDEQTYIARNTKFLTYAVVTPDGTWHSPGDMGWFGFSSETPEEAIRWDLNYYKRFVIPAIRNHWHLTIVDCHI